MDAYFWNLFYITTDIFGKVDISIQKHLKVGVFANEPEELVHFKEERYLNYGAQGSRSDSTINAVHYKPNTDRLYQAFEQDAVEETDEPIFKDWREDVKLCAKFEQHQVAFLKMLTESKGMRNGHLGRITVFKD